MTGGPTFKSYYLPYLVSEAKKRVGEITDLKNVEPGNIITFGRKKTGKDYEHCGIVTDVGDEIMFIHFGSSNGAAEDDTMDNGTWAIGFDVVKYFKWDDKADKKAESSTSAYEHIKKVVIEWFENRTK